MGGLSMSARSDTQLKMIDSHQMNFHDCSTVETICTRKSVFQLVNFFGIGNKTKLNLGKKFDVFTNRHSKW